MSESKTVEFTHVRCFKCSRGFLEAMPGEKDSGILNGLMFKARGQFGSKLFDPIGDQYLMIAVCDKCLETQGKSGNVIETFPSHAMPPPLRFRWEPEGEANIAREGPGE